MVKDIRSGASSSPRQLVVVGSRLLFSADMGGGDRDLWRSDGTADGTRRIAEVTPTTDEDGESTMAVLADRLLYSGDGPDGVELWSSTGTTSGTVQAADIRPGSRDSGPLGLTAFDGLVWFGANDGEHGRELWATDGEEVGTDLVADIDTSTLDAESQAPVTIGDRLLLARDRRDPRPRALDDRWHAGWHGDGQGHLVGQAGSSYASPMAVLGDLLLFRAHDATHGEELWVTDGTSTGTKLLRDITSGQDGTFIFDPVVFDGTVLLPRLPGDERGPTSCGGPTAHRAAPSASSASQATAGP